MRKQYIQIKDSYNTWAPQAMRDEIKSLVPNCCENLDPLIIEWWAHNIIYWATLPFVSNNFFAHINLRCKDVDLMVPVCEE